MPLLALIIKVLILKSKVSIYRCAEDNKVAKGLIVFKKKQKHNKYLKLTSAEQRLKDAAGDNSSDVHCLTLDLVHSPHLPRQPCAVIL